MKINDIKPIVKGNASLLYVKSGGIATYELHSVDDKVYYLDIDLSNKHDCGESARFETYYDKSITLMRWIRRANENGELKSFDELN